MLTSALKRITSLEQLRTPLERAHDLLRRGVPVAQWPMLELEAFTAVECKDMHDLSDAELEALAGSEV